MKRQISLVWIGFIILLILLFFLISINDQSEENNNVETQQSNNVKPVTTYKLSGDNQLKINTKGEIIFDGIVTVSAQSNGIVDSISYSEGDYINKGYRVMNIATNYNGDNQFLVNYNQAKSNLENFNETFDNRKEIIERNIDLAELRFEDFENTRETNKEARENLEDQIENLEDDIDEINETLNNLDQESEEYKTLLAQKETLEVSLGDLKIQENNLDYLIDSDEFPTQSQELTKEQTLTQLELEKEVLVLEQRSRELALSSALINLNNTRPVSPISGTIERIFINVGDKITVGTPLFLVNSNLENQYIEAYVTKQIIDKIDTSSNHNIVINGNTYPTKVDFLSNIPVRNNLYLVTLGLDNVIASNFENGQIVDIELKLTGNSSFSGSSMMAVVPIDSINFTSTGNFINSVQNQKVKSINVQIVELIGDYAIINAELSGITEIILNKGLLEGEEIYSIN